ncbi:DUF6153 family protein [Leifsonia sp. H3M29-4]|uniref:DUF6153 family protein n=1 Tax=Salinibacterium metalliresistens TaxID=3031321 RepID=UPI0023DCA4FA|nr:DUF6153 family protein [Salinibacterium metalliresistens]MDF1480386.1 DUF6153 family protein [Salinibacterium metalliresistens]
MSIGQMHAKAMSGRTLPSRWRRALLALLTVPAVLVGLLAMHFLVNDPSIAGDARAISSSTGDTSEAMWPESTSATPAGDAGECEECAPAHNTIALSCILALLVALLILMVRVVVDSKGKVVSEALEVLRRSLAIFQPTSRPDLHRLSVSRT